MKRDLWKELVKRARFEQEAPETAPFGFDVRVIKAARQESLSESSWTAWMPLLRPALGIAILLTMLSVGWHVSERSQVSRDLLVETDVLIQTAFFNE